MTLGLLHHSYSLLEARVSRKIGGKCKVSYVTMVATGTQVLYSLV